MVRKILVVAGICLVGVLVWNASLIFYGVTQGIGQLSIVWGAKPVEDFLANPSFPDSLKKKLYVIEEVRRYAIDSLGLNDTDNYRTLYDQKGKELMWVVTACEPFQLKPKMWDFPVVGSVPYKGYFNEERALKEARALEGEGLDVGVRNPGGWSTLGWFTDPILSGMLSRSEGDLASLIIHEMVHATIFVKDSIDFNENLASFIADTAAYNFLRWKYGKDSGEYEEYFDENADYVRLSNYMLNASNVLDSLYQTFDEAELFQTKNSKKQAMMQRIIEALDTVHFSGVSKPSERFRNRLPNNTFFMIFRQYQSKQRELQQEFSEKFKGNLKEYISDMTRRYPFL